MSVLIHALALHDLAIHAATGPHMAGGIPNPAPAAPPGLTSRVDTLLAWCKWGR